MAPRQKRRPQSKNVSEPATKRHHGACRTGGTVVLVSCDGISFEIESAVVPGSQFLSATLEDCEGDLQELKFSHTSCTHKTLSLAFAFIKLKLGLATQDAPVTVSLRNEDAQLSSLDDFMKLLNPVTDQELCSLITCADFLDVDGGHLLRTLLPELCRRLMSGIPKARKVSLLNGIGEKVVDYFCMFTPWREGETLDQKFCDDFKNLCIVVGEAFGSDHKEQLMAEFDTASFSVTAAFVAVTPEDPAAGVDELAGLKATQALIRRFKQQGRRPASRGGKLRMLAALSREAVLGRIIDKTSQRIRRANPRPNTAYRTLNTPRGATLRRRWGAWTEDAIALQLALCQALPLADVKALLSGFFSHPVRHTRRNALEIVFTHPEALSDSELVDVLLHKLAEAGDGRTEEEVVDLHEDVMTALQQIEHGIPSDDAMAGHERDDNSDRDMLALLAQTNAHAAALLQQLPERPRRVTDFTWSPNLWKTQFPEGFAPQLAQRVEEGIADFWGTWAARERERQFFVERYPMLSFYRGYMVDESQYERHGGWL